MISSSLRLAKSRPIHVSLCLLHLRFVSSLPTDIRLFCAHTFPLVPTTNAFSTPRPLKSVVSSCPGGRKILWLKSNKPVHFVRVSPFSALGAHVFVQFRGKDVRSSSHSGTIRHSTEPSLQNKSARLS
jgi:hypothetical protein